MSVQIRNNEEECILQEFKRRVEDLDQSEVTLIRFLRARDFNMDLSEDMLRNNMDWRKDNKMDSILDWNAPEYLKYDIPHKITGFDHEHGPVAWIPFGRWKHRENVEQGRGDEILHYGIKIMEEIFDASKRTPLSRCQCLAIFDLEGLSYYQATHLPSLKILYNAFKILEANYPEGLKSIVIINAPWLFSIPFNFLKASGNPNTLAKIKVFDTNKKIWLDYLLERCPKKSLPATFFQDENGN